MLIMMYTITGERLTGFDVVEDGIKARHLLGMRFREDYFSKLSEEEKTELLDFEEQILETRK